MRRLILAPIFVALPLFLAATQTGKDATPLPGAIRLLDGYRHEPRQGIDSTWGSFRKEGGLEIYYDIGGLAGNYVAHIGPQERVWGISQVVNGRAVEIVKAKDGRVVVSFGADSKKATEVYPANFYAKVSNEQDLAALLAIALTYPAAP
jgi:hypothetical protein